MRWVNLKARVNDYREVNAWDDDLWDGYDGNPQIAVKILGYPHDLI